MTLDAFFFAHCCGCSKKSTLPMTRHPEFHISGSLREKEIDN